MRNSVPSKEAIVPDARRRRTRSQSRARKRNVRMTRHDRA